MLDQHELDVKAWEADNTTETELMKAAGTAGQVAMKSAILINGGAAVAMLAFIGHVLSSKVNIDIKILAKSMSFFTFGVVLGAIATGTTYFTQILYQIKFRKEREKKKITIRMCRVFSVVMFLLTIVLVFITYHFFIQGVFIVYNVFMNLPEL